MKDLDYVIEEREDGSFSRIVGRYRKYECGLIDKQAMLTGKLSGMELMPEEVDRIYERACKPGYDHDLAIRAAFWSKFEYPDQYFRGKRIYNPAPGRARNCSKRQKEVIEFIANFEKGMAALLLVFAGGDLSLLKDINWTQQAEPYVFV